MNFQDKLCAYFDKNNTSNDNTNNDNNDNNNNNNDNNEKTKIIIETVKPNKFTDKTKLYLNLPFYELWPFDDNLINDINNIQNIAPDLYATLKANIITFMVLHKNFHSDLTYINFDTIYGTYHFNLTHGILKQQNSYLHELMKNKNKEFFGSNIHNFITMITNNYDKLLELFKGQEDNVNLINNYVVDKNLYKKIKGPYFDTIFSSPSTNIKQTRFVNLFSVNHLLSINTKNSENIVQVKNHTNKNVFKIATHEEFKKNLVEYTFDLLKHIPLSADIIYSGGSLYDIMTHNYDDTTINNFIDLDIFVTSKYTYPEGKGNNNNNGGNKKKLLDTILNNLITNGYSAYITTIGSVYYIFIEGVPRMIQLIFTREQNAETIIENFDSSYVKNYYDGSTMFSSIQCLQGLEGCISYYVGDKSLRMFKILQRGLSIIKADGTVKNCFDKICGYGYDTISNSQDVVTQSVDKEGGRSEVTQQLIDFTTLDYDQMLTEPTILNHLEKQKFCDFNNIKKMCDLYNFDISKIWYFSKIYNDRILDVFLDITKTSNTLPKNVGIRFCGGNLETIKNKNKNLDARNKKLRLRANYIPYNCNIIATGTVMAIGDNYNSITITIPRNHETTTFMIEFDNLIQDFNNMILINKNRSFKSHKTFTMHNTLAGTFIDGTINNSNIGQYNEAINIKKTRKTNDEKPEQYYLRFKVPSNIKIDNIKIGSIITLSGFLYSFYNYYGSGDNDITFGCKIKKLEY